LSLPRDLAATSVQCNVSTLSGFEGVRAFRSMVSIWFLFSSLVWSFIVSVVPGESAPVCGDGVDQCRIVILTDQDDATAGLLLPSPDALEPHAPLIAGAPARTARVGEPYVFQPLAFDQDGDLLTFAVENPPAWASFDSRTGLLGGTPTTEFLGPSGPITVTVSDGVHKTTLPAFSIEVSLPLTGGSAVLTWVAPTQNTDGSALTDLAGYVVRYWNDWDEPPYELDIPAPDTTTCAIEALGPGLWHFEVIAYTESGLRSLPSNRASKSIG
jgi:hypothetical protein